MFFDYERNNTKWKDDYMINVKVSASNLKQQRTKL